MCLKGTIVLKILVPAFYVTIYSNQLCRSHNFPLEHRYIGKRPNGKQKNTEGQNANKRAIYMKPLLKKTKAVKAGVVTEE